MTTTTVDRRLGCLPATFKLAPLALGALLLLSTECRADWKVTPTISVGETYTDNASLRRDDLAKAQFITEAAPGVSVTANSPHVQLSASALWRLFSYSDKGSDPNLRDSERSYQASGRVKLIDNFFYLDGGASGTRQSISAFGQLSDNPYTSLNRTDVSTWRISPYLQHRFGSTATGSLRYTRDSVDAAVGGFGSSMGSTASASLVSGTTFQQVGWSLSYNHQELNNQLSGNSTSQNALASLRYQVIPRFMLTSSVGYDKYEYDALGERTAGPSWTVGFAWTPSSRTSLEASLGHRYFGKTGSLAFNHRTRHTVWTLDYNDQITTTRSQFLLPASIDTASMLDRMFSASFPDAAQRQQAVQNYMAAANLPASLANSINYLSNRYIHVKRLQGGVILRGARSSLTTSLFYDKRNALSLQQSDSTLLGSQLATLNDNVRQRGANIDADYLLTPHTSLKASASVIHAESLDTTTVNNSRTWRMGMSHTISANTRGNIELRHVRGNYAFANDAVYHENAVAATIAVQF